MKLVPVSQVASFYCMFLRILTIELGKNTSATGVLALQNLESSS